jgi:hypothetical protein
MTQTSSFALLARVAVICNFIYALVTAFLFFSWLKIPHEIANFLAVLGLEMAPFLNLLFAIWLLVLVWTKKGVKIPKWQTIINLFMLLIQIALIFI